MVHDIDAKLYAATVCASSGLLILFIYCFFGSVASDDFLRHTDCIFESLWYELPTKLQRTIVMIVRNAQQEMCFDGFGMLTLNLMTFTKVSAFLSINPFSICVTKLVIKLISVSVNSFKGNENCDELLPGLQNTQ